MHQYLQDTEYATKNFFSLATDEERQLCALTERLRQTELSLAAHQWDFQTSDLNDDFSDAYVMAAFARAARAGQDLERVKSEVAIIQASIGTHQHSVQAISGSILQIAKQGISLVHGGLETAPPGRMVGSLTLRDIIWQARNQTLHYEDGTYRKSASELFGTLEREQGPQFSLTTYAKQNRAKQILDLLGWTSYEAFISDMQTLLP